MNTSWQRASGALGLVLALGVGCGDDGMTTTDAGVDSGPVPVDDGGVDSGTDAGPEPGRAGLTFTATLGRDSKDQFDSAAMPFIPEDTSSDRGDLLILLCPTDDAECAEPIVRVVDKANPDEWPTDVGGPAPLQESFGPEITVTDLPAGTYDVMVVYDSLDSQRRGFGWDDDFETVETAWGGIVSETDRMMSTGMPGDTSNPLPETTEVTLVDGETQDLGTITLSHYHERAISMRPAADTGLLVIGNKTDNTIRLLDLETYELVAAGRGVDFPLTDGDAEIRGSLCNVIEGPGDTVYALFTASGTGVRAAGYAAQFDVAMRQQVGNVVTFPAGASASAGPCRAIWHANGRSDYLFAVGSDSSNQGGEKGFWYANVSTLGSADITATLMELGDDQLFDEPLMNVAAYGTELYIGSTTTRLTECGGDTCLFVADFAADGRPTLRMASRTEREVIRVGPLRGDVTVPELGNQTVSCADLEQGVEYFGLTVATFKRTGQDLLIVGGCHEIDMIDLADGTVLDFDTETAGDQGLNAALFGGGFYDFDLSPDGDTLWGISANKSRIMHSVESNLPMGELGDMRITIDRHALMPIDLSADAPTDLPGIAAEYATTDRDGFMGVPPDGINDLMTPANDPGIDVRGAFLKAYYVFWNRSLSGSLPNPFPVGPSIAVTNNTVWLRGAGADLGDEGPSGLGSGSNLSVLDLASQRLVLWPRTPDPAEFYAPFIGLKQFDFGFDLTPETDTTIATAGLVYMAP